MGEPSKTRWLTLNLGFLHSQILLASLRTVSRNYQIQPDDLDAETAAVWYSSRGCETARMTPEETADWRSNLHSIKRANLELIQRWIRTLSRKKEGVCRFRIRLDEAPSFLTVLNDHRLLLAARHQIGQEEMDHRLVDQFNHLTSAQQTALLEMELMGLVMEEVLQVLTADDP